MTHQEAIAKVARLLELAENQAATPAEAATAAAAAQAIMDKYRLERASVEAARGTDPQGVAVYDGSRSLWQGPQSKSWLLLLAGELARANGCRVLVNKRGVELGRGRRRQLSVGYTIIGGASDVAVLRHLFAFGSSEIERLARRAARSGLVAGRTALNNYRHGAVLGMAASVRQAQEAQRQKFMAERGEAGRQAIVRVQGALSQVDELVSRRWGARLRQHHFSGSLGDQLALQAGYRDGARIAIHPGLEGGSTAELVGK